MAGLGHWYVEITKQCYWRGILTKWNNRYILSGVDPSASDATATINALKGIEDNIHPEVPAGGAIGFLEGRAYSGSGGAPIATVTYGAAGVATGQTGFAGPGLTTPVQPVFGPMEVCLDIRVPLAGLSSRGKPVFCRKYIRGWGITDFDGSGAAQLPSDWITAIEGFVAPWHTGLGPNSYVVIGRSGRQPSGAPVCEPFLGNHQKPRGRKRKATVPPTSLLSTTLQLAGDVQKALQLVERIPLP